MQERMRRIRARHARGVAALVSGIIREACEARRRRAHGVEDGEEEVDGARLRELLGAEKEAEDDPLLQVGQPRQQRVHRLPWWREHGATSVKAQDTEGAKVRRVFVCRIAVCSVRRARVHASMGAAAATDSSFLRGSAPTLTTPWGEEARRARPRAGEACGGGAVVVCVPGRPFRRRRPLPTLSALRPRRPAAPSRRATTAACRCRRRRPPCPWARRPATARPRREGTTRRPASSASSAAAAAPRSRLRGVRRLVDGEGGRSGQWQLDG